tara:strand:- start:161 stop:400 length:240 start_codon:yes stop_codon:yes gene_type:complete
MQSPTIQINVLDSNLEMTTRPCEFIEREGNLLCADIDAIDYYGEFRGGTPYIAPELEKWAEEQGGYWEWENAEAIVFNK